MNTILLIVFLVLNWASFEKESCDCKKVSAKETTRYGGNQRVTFIESKVFKKLQGTVDNRSSSLTALVEIFDKPEHLLPDYSGDFKKPYKQKRIAACIADDQGKFCFKNIPPGKYEIRCSIGSEWNVTYVYVVVDPKSKLVKAAQLNIPMELGT